MKFSEVKNRFIRFFTPGSKSNKKINPLLDQQGKNRSITKSSNVTKPLIPVHKDEELHASKDLSERSASQVIGKGKTTSSHIQPHHPTPFDDDESSTQTLDLSNDILSGINLANKPGKAILVRQLHAMREDKCAQTLKDIINSIIYNDDDSLNSLTTGEVITLIHGSATKNKVPEHILHNLLNTYLSDNALR